MKCSDLNNGARPNRSASRGMYHSDLTRIATSEPNRCMAIGLEEPDPILLEVMMTDPIRLEVMMTDPNRHRMRTPTRSDGG